METDILIIMCLVGVTAAVWWVCEMIQDKLEQRNESKRSDNKPE